MDTEDPYSGLPRRRLQLLCKQAGLRANATNKEMAEALGKYAKANADTSTATISKAETLVPPEPEPCRSSDVNETRDYMRGKSVKEASDDCEVRDTNLSQQSRPKSSFNQASAARSAAGNVEAKQTQDVDSTSLGSKSPGSTKKEDAVLYNDPPLAEESTETEKPLQIEQSVTAATDDRLQGLAQELLAEEEGVGGVIAKSHRGLVKGKHVGQRGREERLKRAVEKGNEERGARIAKRRGGGLIKTHAQKASEATPAAAQGSTELTVAGDDIVSLPHSSAPEREQDSDNVVATSDPNGEKSEEGKIILQEREAVIEERAGVPGLVYEEKAKAGAGVEFTGGVELGVEKENDPPRNALEIGDCEEGAHSKQSLGKINPELVIESEAMSGQGLHPGETLVGSLLAEDERVCSGQADHRRCYKSRPFSAKGVEKRVLAAAKKGAGQREAILAERRRLS